MKNWKQFTYVAIIAIVGIIIGFVACDKDNGTITHTHEWTWKVTTPATPIADGIETETCTVCGQTNGTRIIARIPFTSIADLGTWLTNQPTNTVETAFTIVLNVNDISSLFTTLINNADKYVSIDLSGSTITTIPENAFYDGESRCRTLTGIIIPDSVTSIGKSAFDYCSRLASVTIGNRVASIGDYAFTVCTSLTSVTIPNSVISIGEYAFWMCNKLTSVTIGSGVTNIANRTFYECTNLASVTFQGTIVSSGFGNYAFDTLGDLREKFYATDTANGTPGTYTTTAPVSSSSVWQKQ